MVESSEEEIMSTQTGKKTIKEAPDFSPELLDELIGEATTAQELLGSSQASQRIEPVDLAPEAIEGLKEAASHPPAFFSHHDSLVAFLNLSRRCGGEAEMLEYLKSEGVHAAWMRDGSRDMKAWAAEID